MKKKIFYLLLLITSSLFFSCEPQECEEGYVRVNGDNGSTCVPVHIDGIEFNPKLGNTYYHEKHGVIKYNNGKWINEHGIEIQLKSN